VPERFADRRRAISPGVVESNVLGQDGLRSKVEPMRIYMFKSETRNGLRAFASDPAGSKLPQHHGPWTVTGVIKPDNAPPYQLSRTAIEEAIDGEGFKLWRLTKKTAGVASKRELRFE